MQFDIFLKMQVPVPGTFTGKRDACLCTILSGSIKYFLSITCTDEEYM